MKLSEILEQLESGKGYTLEKPWKLAEDVPTVVIPITVLTPPQFRDYYVLPEVEGKVKLTDTGRISGVRLTNKADKSVFVKNGTIFQGKGTQSRALNFSVIVEPEMEEVVEVSCIHASHPISGGAAFVGLAMSPKRTEAALRSRNQHAVWQSVSTHAYAVSMASRRPESEFTQSRVATDDLAGQAVRFEKFDERVKEAVARFPNIANQVGVIVISLNGVEGLELFDHPDSWKAMYKQVAKKYSESYVQEDKTGIFTIDPEKATAVAVEFVRKLKMAKEKPIHQDGYSTFLLEAEGLTGEYTMLKGGVIHLTASTIDKPTRENASLQAAVARGRSSSMAKAVSHWTTAVADTNDTNAAFTGGLARRGAPPLYKKLLKKPAPWSEILKDTKLSKATLSRRLQEATAAGDMDLKLRSNGITVYNLTDAGKKKYQAAKTYMVTA